MKLLVRNQKPFAYIYKYSLLFFLFICVDVSFGQSYSIQGHIIDSTNQNLSLASVLLLDPQDSSLIEFTRADDKGFFNLKKIAPRSYLLKITYVGYLPYEKKILIQDANINLDRIILKPISKELFEVVIRAAKAPMSIRGDTIEYDASTFKVPTGSTLEDLLRKLPGIEVGQDGALTSEGKNITKVTVEGKRFFDGDPKSATKNLPAEGISKVQVFNNVTEEEKLTGLKSNSNEKAMNIALKDEFKKGGFGKISGGLGTESTAELKGNYNKFDSKTQLAIVASGTNTGRNGLSWNDYQDFKGSNSFNWDDNDDFGFGSNGMRYYYSNSGDDEDNLETNFFSNYDNGFPKKISSGLNYNYEKKKTKISSMYFYNNNQLLSEVYRNVQFLYPMDSYNTLDTSVNENKKAYHTAEIRIEQEIDSLQKIIIKSTINTGQVKNELDGLYQNFNVDHLLSNDLDLNSDYTNKITTWQNTLIFRKKFRKAGRSFALSGAYILNTSNRNANQISVNNFYGIQFPLVDSTALLNQNNTTKNIKNQFKGSALYTEPLSKRFYSQTFYNFSQRNADYTRNVFDLENGNSNYNDYYSKAYDNKVLLNRLGTSIKYSFQGLNMSLGCAIQNYNLSGNYTTFVNEDTTYIIDNKFISLIPNFSFGKDMKGNKSINFSYTVNTREPTSNELLNVIDNSNPTSIRIGNPDLLPENRHDININYRKFNPGTFINFYGGLSYNYVDNAIIQSRTIDDYYISTSMPINHSGAQRFNGNLGYGFPIVKNKFTINMSGSYNYSKSFAVINTLLDHTNTNSIYGSLRINITPEDRFSWFLNSSINKSNTTYEINESQNQKLQTLMFGSELNYKFIWNLFLNSSFTFNHYQNSYNDFNSNIPILNLSIYKIFLKNNKGELRISAYDLLDRSKGISQYATTNSIVQTETINLSRYFLLSFTYNMRGIKTNFAKNNRGYYGG